MEFVVYDIIELAQNYGEVSFSLTHREYKVLAHSLAQKAMVENLYETSPKISYLRVVCLNGGK